jgi:hypothetical protein
MGLFIAKPATVEDLKNTENNINGRLLYMLNELSEMKRDIKIYQLIIRENQHVRRTPAIRATPKPTSDDTSV